jgi:hypothetical protein
MFSAKLCLRKYSRFSLSWLFLVIFYFVFLIYPPTSIWAANIYIDPSAAYSGDGSAGTQAVAPGAKGAYNTWHGLSFSASNDYYQKCGTIEITGVTINVQNTGGKSGDRIVIGAYYLDDSVEKIGVSGSLPVIKRDSTKGSALAINNSSYVTIEHLDLRGGEQSLWIYNSSDFVVANSVIGAAAHMFGIRVNSSQYGIIKNNNVDSEMTTYKQIPKDKGGFLLDGIFLVNYANFNVVNDNYLKDWGHNGISINSSHNNTIYNNLIEGPNSSYMRGFGIEKASNDNKFYQNRIQNTTIRSQLGGGKYNAIYENIIDTVSGAGKISQGIMLQGYSGVVKFNKIYNNIIYNTESYGIYLWSGNGGASVESNEISNNIILNGQPYAIYVATVGAGILGNTYKRNTFFLPGSSDIVNYRGKVISVSGFNKENNPNLDIIKDNIQCDPEFIDPINGNFERKPDSSCQPPPGPTTLPSPNNLKIIGSL